jgi:hypothetical protein
MKAYVYIRLILRLRFLVKRSWTYHKSRKAPHEERHTTRYLCFYIHLLPLIVEATAAKIGIPLATTEGETPDDVLDDLFSPLQSNTISLSQRLLPASFFAHPGSTQRSTKLSVREGACDECGASRASVACERCNAKLCHSCDSNIHAHKVFQVVVLGCSCSCAGTSATRHSRYSRCLF